MTAIDPLCLLPPPPPPGCCTPPPKVPAVPISIANPPGLSAIRYRIGTFTSFRRAMLDAVARPDLLPRVPNPFAGWREGTEGDYQTILIELWAYLADILTFYQERIANEAFFLTATQRDSLMRLAELINYHPSPGASASGLVAFTVQQDKTITVPSGFRVGSRAQVGKPAAVFETASATTARGEHNAIPLSVVAPTNQFAPLSSFGSLFSAIVMSPPAKAAEDIYGTAGAAYLKTLTIGAEPAEVTAWPMARSPGAPRIALRTAEHLVTDSDAGESRSPLLAAAQAPFLRVRGLSSPVYQPFVDMTTRRIVLKGINNRLAVGDRVLVVANEAKSNEVRYLFQIVGVHVDKDANTTTIVWREPAGTAYDHRSKEVALYALRVTAGPFGNTAPPWDTLSPTLTNADGQHPHAPYKDKKWDDKNNDWFYIPAPCDPDKTIFLDAVYDAVKGTPENPGWAVLLTEGDKSQILHVIGAQQASKSAYTITSKVTQLTLEESIAPDGPHTFPLRKTILLAGSERLTLQNNLPLPGPLSGRTFVLVGVHPQLQAGQTVILRGNVFDSVAAKPTDVPAAESVILDGPPVVDASNNITTVSLKQPLASQYVRASTVLMANVVDVSHGETVKDEVLGSGDGSAFQTYSLKQKPLTYVPSSDPEGLSAVQSTLRVTVNNVRWIERPTLLESSPDAQVFTTLLDDAGQTSIVFGDGVSGARPPSGKDNIRARYRKGLGTSGNLSPASIEQLIDSHPSLQKVTNPLPSSGGADRESIAQIRVNAPASLRAFDRAVSAPDYAGLALSYPGIAKASASWVLRDAALQAVPHPYVQLTVATVDGVRLTQQPVLLGKFRNFLDTHRDPNVPLRILDFTPVYIDVAVMVDIDDRFPQEGTLARVRAALNPGPNPDGGAGYFAFERLGFGQSIHLSAVYAEVQAVPGIRDATITKLRRMDLDAADTMKVRDNIFIRPSEIAVIQNDPADPLKGLLTVARGKGGFLDS